MVHAYISRALAEGVRQFDFLRGDEPYKYEWGAHDEPIQRLLIRRRDG
jgi:CelD/BcsL family acetyltransferase involved in cellulose biosynthesis